MPATTSPPRPTKTGPSRHRRPISLLLAFALAAATFLASSPAAAQDDSVFPPDITPTGTHGDWTLFDGILGRVYGFAGDGYAVIAGGPLDEVCTGELPPILPQMIKQKPNGLWEQRLQPGVHTVTAHVYETDLGVFEFFDAMCPLYGTDAFPEAFASGDVVIRNRGSNMAAPEFNDAQSAGRYSNGIRGNVFDADGDRFRLRAWIIYDLDAEGAPDFHADRLAMRPVGRHS